MRVKLLQIDTSLNRDRNIKKHIQLIEEYKAASDLIIFPELSLNGYMLKDLVFDDKFELIELDIFRKLSHEVDILLGCVLSYQDKIYNSAIYFSNSRTLSIHNKNRLPNYSMFEEARYFFASDTIEGFQTELGTTVSLICEDLWSAKIIDRVVELNPNAIFVIASSPARDFEEDGLKIASKWEALLKTLSIFTGAYVIFVNRVGFEDGIGFWGGTSLVFDGKVEKRAKLFEEDSLDIVLSKNRIKRNKYLLRD